MRNQFLSPRSLWPMLVVGLFLFGSTCQRDFLTGSQKIAQINSYHSNSVEPFYQFDFEYDRGILDRIVLRDGSNGAPLGSYEFTFQRGLLIEQQQFDADGELLQTLYYAYGSLEVLAEITWVSANPDEPERSTEYHQVSKEMVISAQKVEGGAITSDTFFIDEANSVIAMRSWQPDSNEVKFLESRTEFDAGIHPFDALGIQVPIFLPNSLLNGHPNWLPGNIINWQISMRRGNQNIIDSGELSSLIQYNDQRYPVVIEYTEVASTGGLWLNEQRVEISYH